MATNSVLSLIVVTAIFISRLFVPSRGDQICKAGKTCTDVDESVTPIRYLMVGNPGTGKSTMLNGLAGKPVFESGISYGAGKTSVLQSVQIGKDWYMDTPGLSDIEMREKAAKEIEDALNDGGAYKIIFVLTLESGRVRPADRTTMELVLKSAPIKHYGVLINKMSRRARADLLANKNQAYEKIVAGINTGLPAKTLNFHFKQEDKALEDEDNAVPVLDEEFKAFLQHLPAVEIASDEVKAIDVNEYDKITEKFEKIIKQMHEDKKALQEKLENDRKEYTRMINDMVRRQNELKKGGLMDVVTSVVPTAISVWANADKFKPIFLAAQAALR
jgi:GTPase Era involved in 16S rRNA processing